MPPILPDRKGVAPPDPKKTLAQFRHLIQRGAHWCIATADARGADDLRGLAAVVALGSRAADDVFLAEAEHFTRRNYSRTRVTVVALAKSAIPVPQLCEFFRAWCGVDIGAQIRGGCDLFPVGRDRDLVAGILDQIEPGVMSVIDARAN